MLSIIGLISINSLVVEIIAGKTEMIRNLYNRLVQ